METLEQIKTRAEAAVPGAKLAVVANGSAGNPDSLRVDSASAVAVARFLRDDSRLRLDYASNVTGVDWLEKRVSEVVLVKKVVDEVEQEFEQTVERVEPGYMEVVYHLYSMELQQGPVVLRLRTGNRTDDVRVPSLTPVYRGAELQEREVYDLYGIVFEGHPDLRRLLMWPEFLDHPMRRDYVEPDDYEYEPTPHGEVLTKAKGHFPR
ncbi:MAG TPA: NADH-quinone oxidoreductase subunit C [Candidatus Paceibacterota bacterium]|nr:NADH-quinone oxidoreductase subunit C [Verrucomicrobiota bacterium]HRY48750.1 NADH-quinone oxidoreductase subunit C [Candidatus Paceibacterota bacterium]HSA03093.1 NADH-quinone oxidoreductase subunit C [Candidatus Paceibacterota bacterium]